MSGLTEAEYQPIAAVAYGNRVPHDHDPLLLAVERIIADREKALRESIARHIEQGYLGPNYGRWAALAKSYDEGLRDAANIARGGAR